MATAAITADDPVETPQAPSGRTLLYAAIVIVVGIFATTLAQPQVLARLPLQNMLKNELHISRTASASFFFLCGLPWYFKPLAGVLTDAFPIFGTRRKSYAAIATLLGVAAWGVLYVTPHVYGRLLWACLLINVFMMVASTVVGAYMVETAQSAQSSGRLTALRNLVDNICLLIRGPAAGILASIAFGWTAAACGSVLALLFPVALFVLYEQRRRVDAKAIIGQAQERVTTVLKARGMWAVAAIMAVFYLAPGLSTALFYKQQDELHMTPLFQGSVILTVGAAFGILAALSYAWLCQRVRLHALLIGSILLVAAVDVGLLLYTSIPRAVAITAAGGATFTLAELAFMDLAVRATPRGSEGMGFSLLMSVRNLCLFGTDTFGSSLLDSHTLTFNQLALANGAVVLLAAPLVLFLPHTLVRRREAELYLEAAVPADEFEP
jgi:MFS family permease